MHGLFTVLNFAAAFPLSAQVLEVLSETAVTKHNHRSAVWEKVVMEDT